MVVLYERFYLNVVDPGFLNPPSHILFKISLQRLLCVYKIRALTLTYNTLNGIVQLVFQSE